MLKVEKAMRNKAMILNIFVCLVVGCIPACSGISGKTPQKSNLTTPSSVSPTTTPQQSKSQNNGSRLKSTIRQVDFGNFTFPKLPTGKCSSNTIHLINGRYEAPKDRVPRKLPSNDCWSVELGPVYYGDVTGDGEEEAMVAIFAERGGNSSYLDVYIYTLSNERPLLLWKFMTGDRADGGLRRVYSENGELIIELYGVGTIVGKQLNDTEDVGDCCPRHYTRTKYIWDSQHFQQDGKEEVSPNPSGSSALLLPEHPS